MDTGSLEQISSPHGTHNTDGNVTEYAESPALHQAAGQPSCNKAYENKP